jgi:2,3-bisphosphoglycerate-independent phosphoglycerate mutase
MSAYEVTEALLGEIASDKYDFIVLNYANPDMVGHTGDLGAAVQAVEVVDECLGRVIEALRSRGGAALIIGDHGNCDQMVDPQTGEPHTNHTLNPVPCILIDDQRRDIKLNDGVLANVAPTLLEIIGLPVPEEMDQPSLIAVKQSEKQWRTRNEPSAPKASG